MKANARLHETLTYRRRRTPERIRLLHFHNDPRFPEIMKRFQNIGHFSPRERIERELPIFGASDEEIAALYPSTKVEAERARSRFENLETYCMFLGTPRCGHSVVGSLLDAHRNITIAHELDTTRYLKHGYVAHELYYLLAENSRQFSEHGRLWGEYSFAVPGLSQGDSSQVRVIGDTTVGRTTHRLSNDPRMLDRLMEIIPLRMRFIHVFRNPLDNIATFALKHYLDLGRAIQRYFLMCEINERLISRVGNENVIGLRQEDFLHNPREQLARLCRFLGVEPDDSYLAACAEIVFPSSRQSRHKIQWPRQALDFIQAQKDRFEFLRQYSLDVQSARSFAARRETQPPQLQKGNAASPNSSHIQNGSDYPQQFVLCRSVDHVPAGWSIDARCGWLLARHVDLPSVPLLDKDQRPLGWLLGYAVDLDSERQLRTAHSFDVGMDDESLLGHIQSWLDRLSGRFAAVLITPRTQRVYLDASGSLSVVFCPELEMAASTLGLVPNRRGLECTRTEVQLDLVNKGHWYPFGLTPRLDVERLLPNHFLDLARWTAVRHWPTGPFGGKGSVETSIETIAQTARAGLRGLCRNHRLTSGLTAGRDTRMVLACLRNDLDRVQFVTFRTLRQANHLDCSTAQRLAGQFGLDHRQLEPVDVSADELHTYFRRTGQCVTCWPFVKVSPLRDPTRIFVPGFGGEVGRAYYWRNNDSLEMRIAPHQLLARMGLPVTPRLEQRAADYLAELESWNLFEALGLAYVEQRLGCWAGPIHYGYNSFCAFNVPAFCSRKLYAEMMGLPYPYQAGRFYVRDVIKHLWPDLLDIPFNGEPAG